MAGQLLLVSVISAVFVLASAKVANITDCKSVYSNSSSFPCQVLEARITPCENKAFCKLLLKQDAAISFDFVPGFDAKKLKTSVYWKAQPFPGLDTDACKGTQCPVEKNKKQTFETSLHVGAKLPTGTYDIYWKLWNEENEAETCCFMTKLKLFKKK